MAKPRTFGGTEARRMLRRARTGALASLNRDDGYPFASLVNVATDLDGAPVILVSDLSWHAKNLAADGRASILVAETPAEGDALTGPRITVLGEFRRTDEARLKRRFLARHPESAMYAEFSDFAFWRIAPTLVHAVAGFGRIETLDAGEVFPPTAGLVEAEEEIMAEANRDHAEAIRRLAGALVKGDGAAWRMAAIDCDGADLTDATHSVRLEFSKAAEGVDGILACLRELTGGEI
jgi:hypothetical protein